ncbi:CPBP family intramembrane metalloprotease [Planctomicrobium sp.]|nr:CPBP family intramembrane glutamic endopeptidase [Planctomicrobium sp.]MDA7527885.1 CPBP family intramembrane metalloprotease [bacterium]MDB4731846.1 CPBP family intramembrane metalloprotease [bacterium]MDB4743507.1 CPBP family intramembrane metalloprotease [Planctomicrobium sp.]
MNLESREDFLTFTGVFLFSLLSVTVLLAYWAEVPLTSRVHWNARDFGIGLLAAVVMYFGFSWMTSLRDQAGDALGKSLAQCHWYDLAILAILVGVIEELMFRGLLEQWLARWDPVAAFFIANIIFGLLHAISPLYAILAATLGGILSLLTWWVGDFNLLRPIVAHAVYDFIGFMVIGAEYRKKESETEIPLEP